MRTCILHIGMHKTGSSSIQKSLSLFRDSKQYVYPTFDGINHGSMIGTIFSPKQKHLLAPKNRNLTHMKFRDRRRVIFKEFLAKIRTTKNMPFFLISGEGITSLKVEAIEKLHIFLTKHFDRIIVVIYIRTPKAYMASAFQEKLKTCHASISSPEAFFPQYRNLFEKFETYFGKENIDYRLFSPATFPSQCVVTDFCSKYNIYLPKTCISRVNESLSVDAISLLYAYRKFGPSYSFQERTPKVQKLDKTLIQALGNLPGKKIKFNENLTQPVLQTFQKDISWMEDRLGISLDEKENTAEDSIKSEEDFWCFSAQAISWLTRYLKYEFPVNDVSPFQVAEWIEDIRMKLSS